jgi:cellobiose-specific phosphotransferase system component IIB
MSERPDQLDQQVAMAINEIRREANRSRINVLFIPPKRYKTITADMVVRLEPP